MDLCSLVYGGTSTYTHREQKFENSCLSEDDTFHLSLLRLSQRSWAAKPIILPGHVELIWMDVQVKTSFRPLKLLKNHEKVSMSPTSITAEGGAQSFGQINCGLIISDVQLLGNSQGTMLVLVTKLARAGAFRVGATSSRLGPIAKSKWKYRRGGGPTT